VDIEGEWGAKEHYFNDWYGTTSDQAISLRAFETFWNREGQCCEPRCDTFDEFLKETFYGDGYWDLRNEEQRPAGEPWEDRKDKKLRIVGIPD
jgi:hypothetical protein